MKRSLCLNLAVTVLAIHFLAPEAFAFISKRCQSVCSRSDGQDFCQRCRMRVPMRFGKRTDSSLDLGNSKSTAQRATDEEEDESRYDVKGSSSPSNIREETQILLNSMRNYVKDLDDWNRDFYDQ